ncbi:probable DNA mismatch repair protein Msh6 [Glossina fuscipes]|uniref:DNA mismatch repair protein n=1 Tax=Glossina fuscipes TaxID=7396 RepID=A0A8U0W842_9MUSC|nr:probable DNA mismatch repair protein Msh6 [Glossina fuscipes]
MSKKLNNSINKSSNSAVSSQGNTLFKYFSKSPAPSGKKKIPKPSLEQHEGQEQHRKENVGNNRNVNEYKRKFENNFQLEESDEEVVTASKKRRRFILSDSDGEEENIVKPYNKGQSREDDNSKSESPNKEISSPASDDKDSDRGSSPDIAKRENKKVDKVLSGVSFMEKLQHLQSTKEDENFSIKRESTASELLPSNLDEPVIWPHQKLEFLQPDKIKDKNGRRPDHPEYDCSTLYVPQKFLDSLSPGVRQWWILKSDNYDCVLFFKVGKFYELYHMDADVGVKELGFTYMRGEFAHSGFPEVSFDKMSSILVEKGFKVARVEQTETPEMMIERCKRIKPTKFDKVVRREICQILNLGTQVFGNQCQVTAHYQPNYMLAIVETHCTQQGDLSRYGICFLDTSIGDCYLGEFEDDRNCSRLHTLISHYTPVLVLIEKSNVSNKTQDILRTVLSGVKRECWPANGALKCTAERTLKELAENYYSQGDDNWPLVLRSMQAETDHLGLTPHPNSKLALKAMGLCMEYMKKCKIIEKVLPMVRYHLYQPPDSITVEELNKAKRGNRIHSKRSHMVLDASTLLNLRIVGEEHSLQSTLDHCCTKFGKRLLHHWLCAPSCIAEIIRERQEAITNFLEKPTLLQDARALMAPLPDFERHLAQIHHFGSKIVQDAHPDGRAILFEEKLYNKKKMQSFVAILKGFETLLKVPTLYADCESALLRRLSQHTEGGGIFPNMKEKLDYFKQAFDHKKATESGVIAPESGIDEEYDAIEFKIANINKDLQEYLIRQEKYFGCRLSYFGNDKKRFQIEIPESHARKAGSEYLLETQRKGSKAVRRFSTQETRDLLKQMISAEDERNGVLNDLTRRIFEKFSQQYTLWQKCVDCVAQLDVIASLAEYARQQVTICVPIIEECTADQSFIEIESGFHPCIAVDSYIPNGLILGTDDTPPLSILTGPNMGGKSTLMRQVGLLAVMSQIGAHVPAQSCRMTLVDRIFTRLGAQDDILSGQSTFLVELNETSLILMHATRNSLVLLDELGRGTATYDGTAIAAAVVNFLADRQCRTLFSTHYHNLIDFFHDDKRITLGHMACMVENDDSDDPTKETVTFLYKYTSGACPKSYGFNAAKLAGMPGSIIKRAYTLSKQVETIALKHKMSSAIVAAATDDGSLTSKNYANLKDLIKQFLQCRIAK